MRTIRDGLISILLRERGRSLALPALLVALATVPMATGLYAKDKNRPAKEIKVKDKVRNRRNENGSEKSNVADTVANKVDESTRIAGAVANGKHPVTPALEAIRGSLEAVQKLPAYSCTFTKQEQLKKGEPLRQVMSLKLRREPFSVYLKYVEPHEGREVIFVEGRNKGKLQVHEPSGLASVVGTISLSPTGGEALKENKYPVTMIGMEKMLEKLIEQCENDLTHSDVQVELYPQAKLGEIECTMFEITHPQPHEALKFHKSRIYIEKKTKLPLRAEQYGFPNKAGEEAPLIEEYMYSDVTPNVTPTDDDFDIRNDRYGFK